MHESLFIRIGVFITDYQFGSEKKPHNYEGVNQ